MQPGELATILGGFLASALAIVRYSLAQHRSMADRFVSFLEAQLARQERLAEEHRDALAELGASAKQQTAALSKIARRLKVTFDSRREG